MYRAREDSTCKRHTGGSGAGIELYQSSNGTIDNNIVNNNQYGIYLEESAVSLTTIKNNTIKNNDHGIYLEESTLITIKNNTITNNQYGIYLEESAVITIKNNTISNNEEGIRLYYFNTYINIACNTIKNNYRGIYIYGGDENFIRNNTISNNEEGIAISVGTNNLIYGNNFIDNASIPQAWDNKTNFWDNGYPDGGNYWSDYKGIDQYSGPNQDQPNSDGIGDTPYTGIGEGAGADDYYPLMQPHDIISQGSEANCFLEGSLHCPDTRGYPCNSCSSLPGYINHFKGFNVLTTNEDCYVKLTYNDGDYMGNRNSCEVTIKGERWLGLENESGTKLAEEINSERFNFNPANKFIERTMNFPRDNYKYEFANGGKEFRLYLSRNREEAFRAVPWQNIVIEIKNKDTNNVFTYEFEKGIFPLAYSWSNGVANYGQCVWWTAKRWVEEVDSKTLFPFYPPSPEAVNVKTIDSNYQPKEYDVLINYNPGGPPGHYGFVEKVEGDKVYITQFNFIPPGEAYNHILRTWNRNATNLFYSNNPNKEYYFKYYYRRMSTVEETGTYSLRGIGPAGGYIFYDKGSYSNGWRYLEAAPASTEWKDIEWGSWGPLIRGTGTSIGTGQINTTTIVTWLDSHGETDKAAQLCDALVYGGYTDWFLPSKDELDLMYGNLHLKGIGGFGFYYYWSSSESNSVDAWHLNIFYGVQYSSGKDYGSHVRAVRAF